MSKRKEAETSSDCSEILNPERFPDFLPKSSYGYSQIPNLKKQKRSTTINIKNPTSLKNMITTPKSDICPRIEVEFFNVQLNKEPFYDFFAKEINNYIINHKTPERNVSDISLSLSLPYSNNAPVMTSTVGPSISPIEASRSQISTDLGGPLDAVPLRMYNPTEQVKWTVRKILTVSDCNAQHRLLIKKKLVEDHIISHLNGSGRLEIDTPGGFRVDVLDCDMGIQLKLTLKKWASSQCYGLMDNWRRDFVYRRGLKPGYEVGLCWDEDHNRLLFTVLK